MLSDFQRVNGDDELLPLYSTNITNTTNTTNNIISKRLTIFITICIICFFLTSISMSEFIKQNRAPNIEYDND